MSNNKTISLENMYVFTATVFSFIALSGILYFAKFGLLNWKTHEEWASFGGYISGTMGTSVAMLALFWLSYSVALQKKELEKLHSRLDQEQRDTERRIEQDRELEDCRKFLDENINHLKAYLDLNLNQETQDEIQKLLSFEAKNSFSGVISTPKHVVQVLTGSYKLSDMDKSNLINAVYENDQALITNMHSLLKYHFGACQRWLDYAPNDDRIPYGVIYALGVVKPQITLLSACGLITTESEEMALFSRVAPHMI